MARHYPRFIFSNPQNAKSEGPFVVHTIPPRFIAILKFKNSKLISTVVVVWEGSSFDEKLEPAVNRMESWVKAQIKSGEIKI